MPESIGGIAISDSDIYVGGMFTTAGVVASNHFGLWHEPGLAGHVTWQGRQPQPDPLQQLPITLTLKSGTNELNYRSHSANASGVFTAAVGSLAQGVYNWRVKNPKYLANAGVVNLTDSSTVSVEMGLMRAGDANDDNVVSVGDFNILKLTFGKSIGDPGYDDRADFTGDPLVNISDFLLVKVNYGQEGAPPVRP